MEAISSDLGRALLSSGQGNLTTVSAGDHLWLLGVGLLPRELPHGALDGSFIDDRYNEETLHNPHIQLKLVAPRRGSKVIFGFTVLAQAVFFTLLVQTEF